MATALLARMRFGSSKATAPCELGLPSKRKAARKIAALLARKDGSHPMHQATKECELPESANRSIAREGQSSCVSHRAAATSALDKQCLLIEVHLTTFNTNLAHLSDTPIPLTGVCCNRYVGTDKARRYRAHEEIPGGPIGGCGSRRPRGSTGRRDRICRGRERRRGEVL